MVNWFKVNLRYGSQADIWFKDLTKTEKDMYDRLVDAFKTQWPLTKQLKASKAERVQALKEWILKAEELGEGEKVEGPGGSKVYAHIQWANRLAARVREAEDSSGFALGEVFKDLPHPVKDLIRREK